MKEKKPIRIPMPLRYGINLALILALWGTFAALIGQGAITNYWSGILIIGQRHADDLAKAQGDNRQIVPPQAQSRNADNQSENTGYNLCACGGTIWRLSPWALARSSAWR